MMKNILTFEKLLRKNVQQGKGKICFSKKDLVGFLMVLKIE